MIRAIIFDFDNCLASAKEFGEELFEPAFEAIRKENKGKLTEDELARAFDATWRKPLDAVAPEHHFSEAMLEAGWKAFRELEVPEPMKGYGDLHVLSDLP